MSRSASAFIAGLPILWVATPLAQADEGTASADDCALYRQGETVTFPIGVYHVPPIHGGTMELWPVTVARDYLGLFGFLNLTGEADKTAVFEVEIGSGLPPDNPRHTPPSEYTHLSLLIHGLAYGQPGYALGAIASTPIGEPLTVAPFQVLGPGPSGFSEVWIEGQADHVTAERQIFVELGTLGEVTAVLSCNKPGAVPNPGCTLDEQVGLFDTKAHFNRTELPRLDLIRERVAGFTNCLTADDVQD